MGLRGRGAAGAAIMPRAESRLQRRFATGARLNDLAQLLVDASHVGDAGMARIAIVIVVPLAGYFHAALLRGA